MIVDQFEDVMKKTSQLFPLPTASASSTPSVAPVPSVVPGSKPIYEVASDTGNKTLWVVFVLMLIASAAFTAMSWKVPVSKRLFHVITTIITLTAALSYFAMATGHGVSLNKVVLREQHDHVPDTTQVIYREVYFARYIDWCITTPLLLLDLGLLAGMSGAHIIMAIVADVIMILTGLFAAFGAEGTPQKWGWYTISCIAFIFVIWHLVLNGGANARAKGDKLRTFFVSIGAYTLILWTAYPIVWGLADGSRKAGVDGEIIAYAVLDVLAKGVFGAWLLIVHANMRESDVELNGFWANGLSREGAIRIGEDDGA
ncbi:family A G protein-coupled receptor-like protein [Decorospora gaudefroyi]|uniref:Family A G protein-coupled receptor-like protein n=1 Tax=Decorospora gaudefroyi TaxID=184978 RepID=A0A6A5KE76_9PLEO|nr:family A G protein-coupled receptor-like protein [Decorospora gaudefroyi]